MQRPSQSDGPHAVTSTTGTAALSLTYDANGNLATQGTACLHLRVHEERRSSTGAITGVTKYFRVFGPVAHTHTGAVDCAMNAGDAVNYEL
ncbi:MAG: hypothetical protein ACYC9X_02350 [Dehalococcoidia bacterium]